MCYMNPNYGPYTVRYPYITPGPYEVVQPYNIPWSVPGDNTLPRTPIPTPAAYGWICSKCGTSNNPSNNTCFECATRSYTEVTS